MDKSEILSLIKLIDDPDEEIFEIVRNKILETPHYFKKHLEDYYIFCKNKNVKDRLSGLLNEINLNNFLFDLTCYFKDAKRTLFDGVLLLEQYFDKDADIDKIRLEFDNLTKRIWIKNKNNSTLETLYTICRTLFEDEGYTYDTENKKSNKNNKDIYSLEHILHTKEIEVLNSYLFFLLLTERFKIPLVPFYHNPIIPLFFAYYADKKDIKYNSYENVKFFVSPQYSERTLNIISVEDVLTSISKSSANIQKHSAIKSYDYFLYTHFHFRFMHNALNEINKVNNCANLLDLPQVDAVFKKFRVDK